MSEDVKELTYHQRWYQENKERLLARQKEYYNKNGEGIRARNRKIYQDNKEQVSLYRKEIRDSDPDRFHQYNSDYYKNNTEKVLVKTRKYQEENKESYRIWGMSWREVPKNRIKESVGHARASAPRRGLSFDPELFKLADNPPTHCACCKIALDYSTGKGGNNNSRAPTLDRVDNSQGYTLENVRVICRRCNHLKSNASFEEIVNFYKYMKENIPKYNNHQMVPKDNDVEVTSENE